MIAQQTTAALCQRIYQRQKDQVVVGEKTAQELLRFARDFADWEEVPLTQAPQAVRERVLLTAREALKDHPALADKAPSLRLFRLPRTPRNQPFYQEGAYEEGEVTFWLEMESAWFQTGCTPLFARLRRAAGISPEDLEAQGEAFALYLFQSLPQDPENPMTQPVPSTPEG